MLAKATAIFVPTAVRVFAVVFKWVLFKNKFKDSSEGLGGDRGVFLVESLVWFAYCVYSLFLWDICVQSSNV